MAIAAMQTLQYQLLIGFTVELGSPLSPCRVPGTLVIADLAFLCRPRAKSLHNPPVPRSESRLLSTIEMLRRRGFRSDAMAAVFLPFATKVVSEQTTAPGLTTDLRCVCTTEKTGRCPERPLSSSCPIQFAGAANVGSPPLVTTRDFKRTQFRNCSESSLCPATETFIVIAAYVGFRKFTEGQN